MVWLFGIVGIFVAFRIAVRLLARPTLLNWGRNFWSGLTKPERIECLKAFVGEEIRNVLRTPKPDDFPEGKFAFGVRTWEETCTQRAVALAKDLPDFDSLDDTDQEKLFRRFLSNSYAQHRRYDLCADDVINDLQDRLRNRKLLASLYDTYRNKAE